MTLNKDMAQVALQFLGRVDLKGNEAPTFMQLVAILQAIAAEEPKATADQA